MNFLIALIASITASLVFLNAGDTFKMYKIKSIIAYYDVKTYSFNNNSNSQVQGIAKLVFDNWGAKELKEEDVSEIKQGDFNYTKSKHKLILMDNGTIYLVDFNKKKIIKTRDRDLDMAIVKKLNLSNQSIKSLIKLGAKKIGVEKIANLKCDVWEYKSQQVCLYKGIPLKIIIKNASFYSEKKAIQVILNKQIPAKEFMLPKFPIIEDDSYSDNKASFIRINDYIKSIEDLKNIMKKKGIDLEDKNLIVTPKLEKDIINILSRRYLEKQKKYLKPLIEDMKKEKECLVYAKTKKEALKCLELTREINNKLGSRTAKFNFDKFNNSKREKAIRGIEYQIKNTEITADCVNRYSKTTDVINCTDGKSSLE